MTEQDPPRRDPAPATWPSSSALAALLKDKDLTEIQVKREYRRA